MYLEVKLILKSALFDINNCLFLGTIYTANEANSCSVWPSPEQLKGRIIIRVCLQVVSIDKIF